MPKEQLRAFDGAVALITGGASGIGRAFALELARRGAKIALADLQAGEMDAVRQEIQSKGGVADSYILDVTAPADFQRVVDDVVQKHGRLDYLFNNAGIGISGEVIHCKLDDWKRVVDVNLMGVIHGVHAAYPILCRQKFGHIINTASMAGLLPGPNMLGYTTTKHAVVGLSRALRIEAETHGVRVSVLCPGVIKTPILDGGKFGGAVGNASPQAMKEILESLGPMDVHLFARRALRDIERNHSIIIHPSRWRWVWWLTRLFPSFAELAGRKSFALAKQKEEQHKPTGL